MTIFIDRWGSEHHPTEDDTHVKRRGIFGACITREHILFTWPRCAPEVPELPGGGIDEGENIAAALVREIYEETGARIGPTEPKKVYEQHIHFYAENSDEYWHYYQVYWVLKGQTVDDAWFDGEQNTKDAVKAMWVPLAAITDMPVHAVHREALKEVLS